MPSLFGHDLDTLEKVMVVAKITSIVVSTAFSLWSLVEMCKALTNLRLNDYTTQVVDSKVYFGLNSALNCSLIPCAFYLPDKSISFHLAMISKAALSFVIIFNILNLLLAPVASGFAIHYWLNAKINSKKCITGWIPTLINLFWALHVIGTSTPFQMLLAYEYHDCVLLKSDQCGYNAAAEVFAPWALCMIILSAFIVIAIGIAMCSGAIEVALLILALPHLAIVSMGMYVGIVFSYPPSLPNTKITIPGIIASIFYAIQCLFDGIRKGMDLTRI